ncbi:hypothetical protein REPUB_Repub16aG0018100 [Reevesia pubescens]
MTKLKSRATFSVVKLHLAVSHVCNAFLVEALAARKALELAHDLGLRTIALEGNSFCTVKGINSCDFDLSPSGPVIEEIRMNLSLFLNCSVGHVARKCNTVAHTAAKNAIFSREDFVWVEECPDFLLDVINKDCNVCV